MRLVTFTDRAGAAPRLGAFALGDSIVVDLAAAAGRFDCAPAPFASMLALIDAGPAAWDEARALIDRAVVDPAGDAARPSADIRLLAPLPVPRRLRDCACFLQHLRNARQVRYTRLAAREDDPDAAMERFRAAGVLDLPKEWEDAPVYLNSNHLSIVGPGADVTWPHEARRMDYELEWAAVTGLGGRDLSPDEARACVFGYTIFNDVSARDIQAIEIRTGAGMGGPGKDFDAGNALGPCIVTADEIAEPYALAMVARVNGEEWSRGSTAMMDHRFEDVLAHLSRGQTIHPGEVFGSGTVPTGCGLDHNRYLSEGDEIELEVEGIGIMRNRIVKPAGWRDRSSPDRN